MMRILKDHLFLYYKSTFKKLKFFIFFKLMFFIFLYHFDIYIFLKIILIFF